MHNVTNIYSKTCVKWPPKTDKRKIIMRNGSLMNVESIAECFLGEYNFDKNKVLLKLWYRSKFMTLSHNQCMIRME